MLSPEADGGTRIYPAAERDQERQGLQKTQRHKTELGHQHVQTKTLYYT